MGKFVEGVIATVCAGFVIKVAYDCGRITEARKDAKAWKELKDMTEKAMQEIEDLMRKTKERKETEES